MICIDDLLLLELTENYSIYEMHRNSGLRALQIRIIYFHCLDLQDILVPRATRLVSNETKDGLGAQECFQIKDNAVN